jgi:hypothetical protein
LPEILSHEWLGEYFPTDRDTDENKALKYIDCINPQFAETIEASNRNETHAFSHVNVVNLANLFYQNCIETPIYQSDYYYIANDFYSNKIGTKLFIFHF